MRITLHQCHVFECVAQQRSITRAAEIMFLTQPAVSNLIRQLETTFETPLIEVIGKCVHVTPAGQLFLVMCQDVRECLAQFNVELEHLKGGLIGKLRVAVVTTAKYFMPKLLGDFKQQYPDVTIELTVTNREDVIQRLKENRDDFVIMSQPPKGLSVTIKDFYEDRLVVAASPHNPLAKKKQVPLPLLKEQSWLIREPGSGTRMAMEQWLRKAKIKLNISMEIGNNESIKQSIMANMGISIIPLQSIELELSVAKLVALKVKGFPVKHEWYMVSNKGKKTSPVTQTFLEFIHQHEHISYRHES